MAGNLCTLTTQSVLTPKALNRFRRGCRSCLFKNTSDFGRGGFFGRIITRVSSLMSSSSNLLSDETDNWRWTRSWSLTPDQSWEKKMINIDCVIFLCHLMPPKKKLDGNYYDYYWWVSVSCYDLLIFHILISSCENFSYGPINQWISPEFWNGF